MNENKRNRGSHRGGFTLLEVMIVLLILVTMAGLGVFAMQGQLKKARIRTATAYVKELSSYIDLYEADVGRPPTAEQGLAALLTCPSDLVNSGDWGGPYIRASATSRDPWGNDYQYACPGKNGANFTIWSFGPDGIDGTDDDIE